MERPLVLELNAAVAGIQDLAIKGNLDTCRTSLFHEQGKQFYDDVILLQKNDVYSAVSKLYSILQLNDAKGTRSKFVIEFSWRNFEVDIMDIKFFKIITIVALNFIPSSFQKSTQGQKLMIDIFKYLFRFMNAKCMFSVHIVKTAHIILKRYHYYMKMPEIEWIVFTKASAFSTTSLYSKAVEYLLKMVNIVVAYWTAREVYRQLVALCYYTRWNNWDAHLTSILVDKNLTPITPFLKGIKLRVSKMLPIRNSSGCALKVLQAVIKHISLKKWNKMFVRLIMDTVWYRSTENRRAYMKSTILQCATFAANRFGEDAYISLRNSKYHPYFILVIYSGVSNGIFNINRSTDMQNYLQRIIEGPCADLAFYAFKCVCSSFNEKKMHISPWVIQNVFTYLRTYGETLDMECYVELKYFFSHCSMMISASVSSPDTVATYASVLNLFFNTCMLMVFTRIEGEVVTGFKLFALIRSIFEGNSDALQLHYQIARHEQYEAKEAPSFKILSSTHKWKFNKLDWWCVVYTEFLDSDEIYPEMSEFLQSWVREGLPQGLNDVAHLFFYGLNVFDTGFVNELTNKAYDAITIALCDERKLDNFLLIMKRKLYNYLRQYHSYTEKSFLMLVMDLRSKPLYGIVSIFEMLLKRQELPQKLILRAFEFVVSLTNTIINIITNDKTYVFNSEDLSAKQVEFTLIACLKASWLIVKNTGKCKDNYFIKTLDFTNQIIEGSNMKKVISTAAVILRCNLQRILLSQESYLEVIIIKYLEYVLFSIYTASDCLSSKIRRNPEHRLIIHAIVVADKSSNHPFLKRAMEFLLGILSDSSSTSGSIAAALHTVEIILSDCSLRISTLPFVYSVMVHCINAFSSKDWQINNAAIQVMKALTDRLLGQKTGLQHRYHRIEDVFLLFPKIGLFFYLKLQETNLECFHESIIAILAVFSESHRNCSEFLPKGAKIIVESFLKIFLDIICTSNSSIGIFAAKAYAALYPHLYVPFIICDIIDCLILTFDKMKKNTFYTFLCLLQALYERYIIASYVSYYEIGLNIIQSSFKSLIMFLEKFNNLYEFSLYSLLNIKSNSILNIEKTVMPYLVDKPTYQSRLWLNNNVPYLLNHIEVKKFPNMLQICLSNKFSLSLKLRCLETVLNRHQDLMEHSLVDATLLVLVESFFESAITNEYLLITLTNLIFLLFEVSNFNVTQDLLNILRLQYKHIGGSNIYVISVLVCLLSCVCTYNDTDHLFFIEAIQVFKNASIVEDPQLNFYAASSLKYLYKCVSISQRSDVLKLAYILLLNNETNLEIQRFISESFKVKFSNSYETLNILISLNHLERQLGDIVKACSFLMDLTVLTSSLKNFLEDNGKFYLKQNSDICAHKYSVKVLLLKQIKKAFMILPRETCCKLLLNTDYVLRDK